jgi:hypothetical protein
LRRDAIAASSEDLAERGEARPVADLGQDGPASAALVELPGGLRPRRRWHLHRTAAARHVGRGAHHLLRWVGAFAAVVIIAAVFGIWRLMQGPIELNSLTPYVEAGLQRSGIGFQVALSGVRLGIDRSSHQLELQAENVRLSRPDGTPLARFPEMAAGFGLGALLHGRMAPTEIVIEHPVLHLVRDAGGAISAQIGGGDQAMPDLGPQMLERLAGPPERDAPLALLHRISIRGATLFVDDRGGSRRTWRADRVDIAILRSDKGARGDVSFAVPLGNSTPELHASYRFLAARQLLDLDLSIDGVEPDAIPPLIPELAQLRHIAAPVSGTLETRIDLQRGQAQGSRLDLALGAGRLYSEWLPTGSIAVQHGELHATYAPEKNEVRVASLGVDLGGGTRLALAGTLAGVTSALLAAPVDALPPGHVAAQFTAELTHLPVARFAALWPTAFNPRTRAWTLANIRDGVLDEGTIRIGLDLNPVAHAGNMLSAAGQLRYHGLTVTYLRGLPPVRKVGGTAAFAGDHLVFTPADGVLKGLKLTGGTLAVTELGAHPSWMTIDLGVVGPVKDALEVIDANPLHYARAIGLNPAAVGGRAEARLHFKFPVLPDLKLDEVDFGATATISGASLPDLALGRGIRDGRFALDLDPIGARLQGTGRFADVPAKLAADIPFHPKDGAHGVFRVGLTLDAAAQRQLGFDIASDRLSGPIAIDATYRAFAARRGAATALLDLRDAALAVPEAGWKKPPGQPGTIRVVLDLANAKIVGIPLIAVTAGGLDGRLAATLSPDRTRIDAIEIRRLLIGGDDFSGTVARPAGDSGGGWRADIHAARADASHLLKDAMTDAPPPDPGSPPLAVNARIDRLVFGEGRELRQVSAALVRSGGLWRSGQIAGRFPDSHRVTLQFGGGASSSGGGSQRLVLQSDDLGATLKLLDIADNVVGGRLRVDGQLSQIAGHRLLRAQVDGRNYVVMRTPGLARLLVLPSLTGLESTLSGSGLPFISLGGDVTFGGGRLTLDRLLAYGESLGITANGWIDTGRDRMALQGTVAPSYALNSIVGNVPILGPLLGGGSQGLFAANYRLSGSSADPQISVNPLSALAPGILRQLFAPAEGFPNFPQVQQQPVQRAAD